MIEIRIGVTDNPKELVIEIEDEAEVVQKSIGEALQGEGLLWLTDKKGKQLGIPVKKLAYVEISPNLSARPVGFGR